jgi:hypothetical protein
LTITNQLPDKEHAEFGEPLPADLIGATIKSFGAPIGAEGVGLVLEYIPAGCSQPKVLAFAFDENAVWALSKDQLFAASEDESQK